MLERITTLHNKNMFVKRHSLLERIIARKKQEVDDLRISLKPDTFEGTKIRINLSGVFGTDHRRVTVIAELKKASPVKGVLRADFDLVSLAQTYADNGASVLSVITDSEFFQGSLDYLPELRRNVQLPLLRKDFIVNELQLYETRLLGADMVLLIAALHNYSDLLRLIQKCRGLGIEPLLEIHDQEELKKVLDLPVRIIGVNNRNLKDFTVDIRTSIRLAEYIPDSFIRVSESGIKTAADMKLLEEYGFQAALVGEALVSSPYPGTKLRELVEYDQG